MVVKIRKWSFDHSVHVWDVASKIIIITLDTDFSCDNNNNVNKKMKMMFWSQFAWMRWGLQVGSSSATRGMSSVAVVGDDFDHDYDYEYDWNADDFDDDGEDDEDEVMSATRAMSSVAVAGDDFD